MMDHVMRRKSNMFVSSGILFLWLFILAYRLFSPAAEADGHAPTLWMDYLFLFILYGYLHITALGLGRYLLRKTNFGFSNMEHTLLAYILGFGALSMILAVLGFLGWLTQAGIFSALAVSGLLSSTEWRGIVGDLKNLLKTYRLPRAEGIYEVLLRVLIVGMVPVLLVHVLTPVWDYDALVYHLEIPRRFLEQGAFYFDQEMFRSASPYLGEMLFIVGVVFQLDSFSKLVHLTFAVLLILSVYSFGKRFFNRSVSLTAVGLLISVPSFVLWSTWAGIDFAWAGYEFWSVYAVSVWTTDENTQPRKWLALAGVMSGLAASTKYLAIPSLLIVGILVVLISFQKTKRDVAGVFRNLTVFGLSASLVLGAWYIKNLILTGNPVYPLVFGGPGWSLLEKQILDDYMGSFGVGKSMSDFVALPFNVYAHQGQFSTMPQEIVHPLLWLAFLSPLVSAPRKNSVLILYASMYYLWWFFGSQLIRLLLPVSAVLALFAGDVIERLPGIFKNTLKVALIAGVLVINLVYQTLILRNSSALSYVAGQTPAVEFLQTFVEDYSVKQYIVENVDGSERVLFLWDGRGYYCDSRCIPDSDHAMAVSLAIDSPVPHELARNLKEDQITHVMLSGTDAGFAILFHDPNGYHRRALDYYRKVFLPACGEMAFKDGEMELYRIVC